MPLIVGSWVREGVITRRCDLVRLGAGSQIRTVDTKERKGAEP